MNMLQGGEESFIDAVYQQSSIFGHYQLFQSNISGCNVHLRGQMTRTKEVSTRSCVWFLCSLQRQWCMFQLPGNLFEKVVTKDTQKITTEEYKTSNFLIIMRPNSAGDSPDLSRASTLTFDLLVMTVSESEVCFCEKSPLTTNTEVLTASDTLCLSSAAVPGLLSPRVNFLASGGAEAIPQSSFHETDRDRRTLRRGRLHEGCSLAAAAAAARRLESCALQDVRRA